MNRIYKVLFNKTLGAYAAVSELASVKGKKAVKALAVGSVLAAGLSQPVQATVFTDGIEVDFGSQVSYEDSSNRVSAPDVASATVLVTGRDSSLNLTATAGDNTIVGTIHGIYGGGGSQTTIKASGNNIITFDDSIKYAIGNGIGAWDKGIVNIETTQGNTSVQYVGNEYWHPTTQAGITGWDGGAVYVKTNDLTIEDTSIGVLAGSKIKTYDPGPDKGYVNLNVDNLYINSYGSTQVSGISSQNGSVVDVTAKGNAEIIGEAKVLNAVQGGSINMTAKNINLDETTGAQYGTVTAATYGKVNLKASETMTLTQSGGATTMAIYAAGYSDVNLSAKNFNFTEASEYYTILAMVDSRINMTAQENIDIKGRAIAIYSTGDGSEINIKQAQKVDITANNETTAILADVGGKVGITADTVLLSGTSAAMYSRGLGTLGASSEINVNAKNLEITANKEANSIFAESGGHIDIKLSDTLTVNAQSSAIYSRLAGSLINISAKDIDITQAAEDQSVQATGGAELFMKASKDVDIIGKSYGVLSSGYKSVGEVEPKTKVGSNVTIEGENVNIKMQEGRAVTARNGGNVTIKADNKVDLEGALADTQNNIYAAIRIEPTGGTVTITSRVPEENQNLNNRMKEVYLFGANGARVHGVTEEGYEDFKSILSISDSDLVKIETKKTTIAGYDDAGDGIIVTDGGQVSIKDVGSVDVSAYRRGMHVKNGGSIEIVANGDKETDGYINITSVGNGDSYAALYAENSDTTKLDNDISLKATKDVTLSGYNGIKTTGPNTHVEIEAGGKATVTGAGDKHEELEGLTRDGIFIKNGDRFDPESGLKDVQITADEVEVKGGGRGINIEGGGDVLIKADTSVLVSGEKTTSDSQILGGVRIMDEGSVEITNKTAGERMDSVTLKGSNGIDVTGSTGKQAIVKVSGAEAVDIKALETKDDNDPDGIYVKTGGEVEVKDVGTVKVTGQKRGIHIVDGGKVTIDADGNVDVDASVGQNYAAVYVDNKDETTSDLVDIKSKADVTLSGYNGIKVHGYDTAVNVEAGEKGTVTITGTPDAGALIEGNTRDGIHVSGNAKSSGRADVTVKGYDVNIAGDGRGILSEDGGTVDIKADNTVKISGSLDDKKDNNYAAIRVEKTGGQIDISSRSGNRMEEVSLYGANGMRVLGNPDDPNVSSSVTISDAESVYIETKDSDRTTETDGVLIQDGGKVAMKNVGDVEIKANSHGIHLWNGGGEATIEADGDLIVKNDSKRNTMAVAAETENDEKSTVVLKAKNMVIDGKQALYAKGADTDMTVTASNDMTVYGDIDSANGASIDVKALGTGIIGSDDEDARIHAYGGTADANSSVSVSLTGKNSVLTGTAWNDDPANDKINISLDNGATWRVGTDMPKGASAPDGINSRVTSLKLNGGVVDFTKEKAGAMPTFKTVQTQDFSGNDGHLIQRVDMTKGYTGRYDSDRLEADNGGAGTHTIHVSQIQSSGKTPYAQTGYLVKVKNPDANLNFKADTKQLWELGDRWKDIDLFTRSDGAAGKEWYLGLKDTSIITPTAHAALVLGASSAQYSLYYTQLSDLRKRLGEVRSDVRGKVQDGLWAQIDKHKDSIDSFENSTLEQDVYRMSVGFDRKQGNWLFGGNFKYADIDQRSDFSMSHAKGDAKSYGLNLYATWSNEDGYYSDIVLTADKYHNHLQTHTATDHKRVTGDLSTYGLGASIEVGRKMYMDNAKLWFAEPQGQLSYYWIKGDDFTMSNGMKTQVKNFNGLNLRVGGVLGREFVNSDGTKNQFYAKAGFRQELTAHDKMKLNDNWYSHSMSNTGFYYGLGWDFLVKDNLKIYGEVEREDGDKYTKDYQINIGMKYAF